MAKTETIYLKGKAKYVHANKPDPKYGKYSLLLYPDEESLNKIRELKDRKPAILNVLKKDDEGYFMRFTCEPEKVINGKRQLFTVDVVDQNRLPLLTLVGNGSDVTVKLDWYTYRKGDGAAVRLKAIRVDNLIPYEPNRDFSEETKENVNDLAAQPVPLF